MDIPERLDDSWFELAVIKLWQINLQEFIKNKAALTKNFHISPLDIDKMYMWEYELFMRELNELVKAENEQQEAEMKKSGARDAIKNSSRVARDPMKSVGNYMPKMQPMSMPSFGTPLKM